MVVVCGVAAEFLDLVGRRKSCSPAEFLRGAFPDASDRPPGAAHAGLRTGSQRRPRISRDNWDWAVIGGTIGAAGFALIALVVAVGALIYAAKEIREQSRAHRRARTYEYFDKVLNLDLIDIRIQTLDALQEWTSAGPSPWGIHRATEAWGQDHERKRARARVYFFLNLFEEIGGVHREKLLDRDVLTRVFAPWCEDYWVRAEPWILARRRLKKGRENLYEDWEWLRDDLRKKD